MQTDGRTDMTKLTVAFRNFANVSKNGREKATAAITHSNKNQTENNERMGGAGWGDRNFMCPIREQ
jgi:hypothetical protein